MTRLALDNARLYQWTRQASQALDDNGPGMSAEARAHLFERFWQADAHDRRGAGLGLSIVKGIIEAHGGRVRVESEPGQGTTVFFSVPIATGDASAVRSSP